MSQSAYPGVNTAMVTSLARYAPWYNGGTDAMRAISHFLIGFKAHSTRWNSFPPLLTGINSTTGSVIGFGREPNTFILINGNGIVDLCISAALHDI